jgi:hypothetical protein
MSAVLPQGSDRSNDVAVDRTQLDSEPLKPADRLAASRQRLRAALMTIAHPPPKPSLLDGLGMGHLKDQLVDRVKSLPGAVLVLETIERWWAEHPLHTASTVAGEASRRFIGPVAQRNPLGLLLGAAVVGALFIVSRPWRWLLRPALFVGLIPQLAAQALKRMPLDSWMNIFAAAAKGKPGTASANGTPAGASSFARPAAAVTPGAPVAASTSGASASRPSTPSPAAVAEVETAQAS